jgi:membrane associated rhomboid family serine protease
MSNIVDFKKPDNKDGPRKPKHPPLINLPLITKILLIGMISIHGVLHLILNQDDLVYAILNFGFIPSIWTGQGDYSFDLYALFSPITYMGLHGGWMHLVMNSAMLMAFGAGVEQWMGAKKFLIFFIACGVAAVMVETIIHPLSQNPVIGASGALSGLFAAVLILLQSRGQLPTGKYGIWPFATFWIGISIVFAVVGGAFAGGQIAWAAHLGGFIAGFILLKMKYFKVPL